MDLRSVRPVAAGRELAFLENYISSTSLEGKCFPLLPLLAEDNESTRAIVFNTRKSATKLTSILMVTEDSQYVYRLGSIEEEISDRIGSDASIVILNDLFVSKEVSLRSYHQPIWMVAEDNSPNNTELFMIHSIQ